MRTTAVLVIVAMSWGCGKDIDEGSIPNSGAPPAPRVAPVESDSATFAPLDPGRLPGPRDAEACLDASQDSCVATCCSTPGPADVFRSTPDVGDALRGRWQTCSDYGDLGPLLAPADTVGVELIPGGPPALMCQPSYDFDGCGVGSLYFLVPGPSGPVRGTGAEYQDEFYITEVVEAPGRYEMVIHTYTGQQLEATIRHSTCPTVLDLTAHDIVFVPIP
jgi:hypothetical protein